jgi:hypothetical protein
MSEVTVRKTPRDLEPGDQICLGTPGTSASNWSTVRWVVKKRGQRPTLRNTGARYEPVGVVVPTRYEVYLEGSEHPRTLSAGQRLDVRRAAHE